MEQIECDAKYDEDLDIGYIEDPNEGQDIDNEVIYI